MGHASLSANGLGAGLRPSPAPARSHGLDPILAVDAAVRSALADLRPRSRPANQDNDPVFVDRLFSLRHAETLPPGTRSVQIAPGTVVTPLARDHLKRQGITIRLGARPDEIAVVRGNWAFAIDSRVGTVLALRRALLDDPRPWREIEPTLDEAVRWILEAEGNGVLFVTPEAALNVWKACQVSGIRAAMAAEPGDVHRAARSLGLNLLVVEPEGKSISWMKQLGTAFRLAGAPRIPDHLLWEGLK